MNYLGHNKGPTMEGGRAWRRHCWTTSRQALLPSLPLPVVKRRLKRALELGLEYKAYATVRATTGRDIIALLFSQNALRVGPGDQLAPDRAAHLAALGPCDRIVALQGMSGATVQAAVAAQGIALTQLGPAPIFSSSEADRRRALDALRGKTPGDAVLVIGETAFERSWCATGRFAGYISAEQYFARAG